MLRALKDMILYEDRDLLVLDKPFGLAVQGGSGTVRHIDGMLASMPNERGERPRAGAQARSRYVGRLACREDTKNRRRSWRNFSLAAGAENLLGTR